jgi:hypothetical protein
MKRLILIGLVSLSAIPDETNYQYEKYVDNQLRLEYYHQCKQSKQKDCHVSSFNRSIKLRII